MAFTLPELPWAKEALAPTISAETIDYHYGKHHKAYVDNLNKFAPGTKYESMSLEDVVKASHRNPQGPARPLRGASPPDDLGRRPARRRRDGQPLYHRPFHAG